MNKYNMHECGPLVQGHRILEVRGWGAEKEFFFPPILYRIMCLCSFFPSRQFIKFVLGIKLLARSLIEVSKFFFANLREKMFYSQSLRFLMRLFKDLKTFLGSISCINMRQVGRRKIQNRNNLEISQNSSVNQEKMKHSVAGWLGCDSNIAWGVMSVFCNSMQLLSPNIISIIPSLTTRISQHTQCVLV